MYVIKYNYLILCKRRVLNVNVGCSFTSNNKAIKRYVRVVKYTGNTEAYKKHMHSSESIVVQILNAKFPNCTRWLVCYTFLFTFSPTRSWPNYVERRLTCFGSIGFAGIISKTIFGHIVSYDVTDVIKHDWKTFRRILSRKRLVGEISLVLIGGKEGVWGGSRETCRFRIRTTTKKPCTRRSESCTGHGRRVKNTDKRSFKSHTSVCIIYATRYCIRLSAVSDCVSVL